MFLAACGGTTTSDLAATAADAAQQTAASDAAAEEPQQQSASESETGEQLVQDALDMYQQLSEEEQETYSSILSGVTDMEERFQVPTEDEQTLNRAYQALLLDHPEVFWLKGYTAVRSVIQYEGAVLTQLMMEPEYLYSREEVRNRTQQINAVVSDVVEEITNACQSDYEKALLIYEYLIDTLEYDLSAEDSQNICGAFLGGSAVCTGYAKGFQYLAQQLGMACVTVGGTAQGEDHFWNLICMDGAYYYVDVTWGDSIDAAQSVPNYTYFGLTSEEIERTHTSDTAFDLPSCTETACNYYVRQGLLFDSFQLEAAGAVIQDSLDQGKSMATVRFSTEEAYRQALDSLVAQGRAADWWQGTGDLNCSADSTYRTLIFYWTV